MATHIKTTGEVNFVHPKNGKKFKLEELQQYVGGFVEMIPLPVQLAEVEADKKLFALVNEEGRLLNLPFNTIAYRLCGLQLAGDVLVLRFNEVE